MKTENTNTCSIPNCPHPVSPLAKDNKCIFHTETGKIKEGKFIKPQERDKTAWDIIEEFIREFPSQLGSRIIPRGPENVIVHDIILDEFIFPCLEEWEWEKIWVVKEFKNDVSFKGTIFGGFAYFKDFKFDKEVNFLGTKFFDFVEFSNVKFKGETIFDLSEFHKEVRFGDGTIFYNEVIFLESKFYKEARIEDNVEFKKNCTFRATLFNGDVFFQKAIFDGIVNFNKVIFGKEASFYDIKFKKKALFENCIFLNKVEFEDIEFLEDTSFYNFVVKFLKFKGCKIYTNFRLGNVQKLQKEALEEYFKKIAQKETHQAKELLEKALGFVKRNSTPIILLRNLIFRENGFLLIEDVDFSKVSFWESNFRMKEPAVKFIRIKWHENKVLLDDTCKREEYKEYKRLKEKEKKGEKLNDNEKQLKEIYEEIYKPIEQTENKEEELERCYRQIRLIYESQGEYADAGDFYLHEMRVRGERFKLFSRNFMLKITHTLYGLISKYGESIGRAFVWLLAVLISSAPGFVYKETELSKIEEIISTSNYFALSSITHIFYVFFNSIFTGLNYIILGRIEIPNTFSPWQLGVVRIFGLSILTLLLLAIRRRFRR